MSSKIERPYLRITERGNLLDNLERLGEFLERTDSNNLMWKWVIIAVHDALYGAAICACQGTDSDKVMQYNRKRQQNELISFDRAIKRCQAQDGMYPFGACKPLVLDAKKKKSIEFLKSVRDDFQHFSPMGWSIGIHSMAVAPHDALKIIWHITQDSGAFLHLTGDEGESLRKLLAQAVLLSENSRLYLEAKALKLV